MEAWYKERVPVHYVIYLLRPYDLRMLSPPPNINCKIDLFLNNK